MENNIDLTELLKRIKGYSEESKSLSQTPEEKRVEKVARLIILLDTIQKELKNVTTTLTKLERIHEKTNYSLVASIRQKKETVKRLESKIQKARLNLNFYFI